MGSSVWTAHFSLYKSEQMLRIQKQKKEIIDQIGESTAALE